MARRDIVVIGTSAGGHEALARLCQSLPSDFSAAVFVVWHMPAHGLGLLPAIIRPDCSLPATNAQDGEAIRPGRIYVAPPDQHLLVQDGHVRLTRGPKENRFRPAIDPLFRSAAYSAGPRVIGVVLTGALDDGTSGLWAIKDQGGIAVVQDPQDAAFAGMPTSAISNVPVDFVTPLSEMGTLLVRLTREEIEDKDPANIRERLEQDIRGARMERHDEQDMEQLGQPSVFTCPECHGTLWKIEEGKIVRFRCRTGHAYTAQSLLEELTEDVEDTLWTAVRSLEEKASLMRHIAWHLREHGDASADRYLTEAATAIERAGAVREALAGIESKGNGR
jgi:two-component system, chemotaxis family, protein-glutamate methylesterase/glutaminase